MDAETAKRAFRANHDEMERIYAIYGNADDRLSAADAARWDALVNEQDRLGPMSR